MLISLTKSLRELSEDKLIIKLKELQNSYLYMTIMSLTKFSNVYYEWWGPHDNLIIKTTCLTNKYILSDMAARNMIGCMQSNDKLDGWNYDVWHLKV